MIIKCNGQCNLLAEWELTKLHSWITSEHVQSTFCSPAHILPELGKEPSPQYLDFLVLDFPTTWSLRPANQIFRDAQIIRCQKCYCTRSNYGSINPIPSILTSIKIALLVGREGCFQALFSTIGSLPGTALKALCIKSMGSAPVLPNKEACLGLSYNFMQDSGTEFLGCRVQLLGKLKTHWNNSVFLLQCYLIEFGIGWCVL